jgi:hypothetical protein
LGGIVDRSTWPHHGLSRTDYYISEIKEAKEEGGFTDP